MKRRLISLFLTIVTIFSLTIPASATSSLISIPSPTKTETVISSPVTSRAPNAITISSDVLDDGSGLAVKVDNLGVDGLDSVTVTVTATGYAKTFSQTAYVPPIIGKTFYFDIPYIKVATTYNITAKVIDGSGTREYRLKSTFEYTEDDLAAFPWGAGTFNSRAASLQYHFDTHRYDGGVNASNIIQYLAMALSTFNDTLSNPEDYKIVQQTPRPGFAAAHKYTHKTSGRFILYSDVGDIIYSFGGK